MNSPTLTFSPESADSQLPHSQPDIGPSDSSNENCSVNSSSEKISAGFWPTPTAAMEAPNKGSNKKSGPKSLLGAARLGSPLYSRTSANSTEPNSEALTYLQGDFLASHSVAPGSDLARQMTARSGHKCCALLKRRDPVGLLAKTLLESSIWNSTVAFLTWRPKVTPAKRLLFQLAPSMPDTDETEFGLWPTPDVPNGGRCMKPEDAISKGNTPNGKRQVGLHNAVKFWPTPRANDAEKRGDIANDIRNGLPASAKFWPTPRSADGEKGIRTMGGHLKERERRGNGVDLPTAIAFYPTPTEQDAKNSTLPVSQRDRDSIPGALIREGQSGQLNPMWVEWLMGYPLEHTALSPSEMQSFRKLRSKLSKHSGKSNNER